MAVILSMRLLVLLLAVLFVNADVVQITDSNFAAEVSSNPEQLWMLMFGADWCGHCQHTKPEFEKASNEMSSYGVKFGYVDEKNNRLVGQYVSDPVTHMVSFPKIMMVLGEEVLGEVPGNMRNSHAFKFWFDNTFKIKEEL